MNNAQKVLVHYFRVLFEKNGIPWERDNEVEIEGIVEDILGEAKAFTSRMVNQLADDHHLI